MVRTVFLPVTVLLVSACTSVLGVKDVPELPAAPTSGVVDGGAHTGAVAYAAADCKRYSECSSGTFEYVFADTKECEDRAFGALLWNESLPGSGGSDAKWSECAKAFLAATCDEYTNARSTLLCAVKGARANGEACLEDAQCQSGFCPTEYGCATCADPPASGAPCARGKRCKAGLRCSAKGTCVSEARANEACSDTRPCASPLYCASGTCKAPPATAKAACGSDNGVMGCDDRRGFTCSSATNGVCLAFSVSGAGGACRTSESDGTAQICRRSAACASNVCAAPPKAGDPCDDTRGPLCAYPDRCVNGTCLALPSPGTCP